MIIFYEKLVSWKLKKIYFFEYVLEVFGIESSLKYIVNNEYSSWEINYCKIPLLNRKKDTKLSVFVCDLYISFP